MASKNDFVEYLLELLSGFGKIHARPMFGGFGIYREGLMFGLVAEDVFYVKTDRLNRHFFINMNLQPFRYTRKDREYTLSYYEVPAEALDDPAVLHHWSNYGYDAALRAKGK